MHLSSACRYCHLGRRHEPAEQFLLEWQTWCASVVSYPFSLSASLVLHTFFSHSYSNKLHSPGVQKVCQQYQIKCVCLLRFQTRIASTGKHKRKKTGLKDR